MAAQRMDAPQVPIGRSTAHVASRGGWPLFAALTAFLAVFLVANPLRVVDAAKHRPMDRYSFVTLVAPTITDPHPRAFLHPLVTEDGSAYLSQAGLHGRMLHHARRLWPGTDASFYRAAEVVLGTAFAAELAALLCVLLPTFGLAATLVAALGLALAPFLVCVATDLYWVPVLTFLPTLAAWGLYPRVQAGRTRFGVLCAAAAGAATLKFLCGYEFVSAVLAAPLLAIPFFEPARRWRERATWARAALLAASLLGGFALALALHAIQVRALLHADVFQHLRSSGAARSFGTMYVDYVRDTVVPSQRAILTHYLSKIWPASAGAASLTALVSRIVDHYGSLGAVTILEYFTFAMVGVPQRTGYYYLVPFADGVEFAHVLLLQVAALAVVARLARRDASFAPLRRAGAVSLASLAVPCTWFVLGFGHSVIHSFVVPTLFFLPWAILALLFVGSVAARLVAAAAAAARARRVASRPVP